MTFDKNKCLKIINNTNSIKEIGKITEQSKVTCRNYRRDVLDEFKKMKKDNVISEDDMANGIENNKYYKK